MHQSAVVQRPPFALWACLFGVGAAVPLVSLVVDLLGPAPVGRDFVTFWTAGRLFNAGDFDAIYDVGRMTAAVRHTAQMGASFLYPPHTLLVLAPFGLLPYHLALAAWVLLGAGLLVAAARPFVPFSPILAALTPAALICAWDGQFGLLMGAVWLMFFRSRRGLFAAAMTLKPHLALFLAPRLTTRTAMVAIALTALLILPFARMWPGFLQMMREHSQFVANAGGSFFFRMMPGAYASFDQSWPMQVLFTLAAAAIIVRYRAFDCFTLATGAFVILPYAHNYDMTVACLGFAVFIYSRWATSPRWELALMSLAFLTPSLTYVTPWLVPPILLTALWRQALLTPPAEPRLVACAQGASSRGEKERLQVITSGHSDLRAHS